MAENDFQLPRSSYEEIVKIVRAYNSAGSDATLEDVSKRAAMHTVSVSMNNKFLLSANILQGGNKKSLTDIGTNLGKALEYEMPDQIKAAWKKIVLSSDFFEKVISAVKIRRGMEASALRTHIAYTAGETKSPKVMTGAKTIIDILVASGLINEVDGKYLATSINETKEEIEEESTEIKPPVIIHETKKHNLERVIDSHRQSFNINFNIEIKCDVSELESLGSKLKKIVDELEESENKTKE